MKLFIKLTVTVLLMWLIWINIVQDHIWYLLWRFIQLI